MILTPSGKLGKVKKSTGRLYRNVHWWVGLYQDTMNANLMPSIRFDIIFTEPLVEIKAKFLKHDTLFMSSAECGCWPQILRGREACYDNYPEAPTLYRFLLAKKVILIPKLSILKDTSILVLGWAMHLMLKNFWTWVKFVVQLLPNPTCDFTTFAANGEGCKKCQG